MVQRIARGLYQVAVILAPVRLGFVECDPQTALLIASQRRVRFESRRMCDSADGSGLALRQRTHEHVVVAAIIAVPRDPYGAIRIRRNGGIPVVGRRFAHSNFRSPGAALKLPGVYVRLPIAKGLPSQPKIALAVGGHPLAEVRSVRCGQPFDRAPCLSGLAPVVQIPVAIHLRRPDRVQCARAIVGGRRPEHVNCLRRIQDFGGIPCRAVPLARNDAIPLAAEFLPYKSGAALRTGGNGGKVGLPRRTGHKRMRHEFDFDIAAFKRQLPPVGQVAQREREVARAQYVKARLRTSGDRRVHPIGEHRARARKYGAQIDLLYVGRPGARGEGEFRRAAVCPSHLVFVLEVITSQADDLCVPGHRLDPSSPRARGSVGHSWIPRRGFRVRRLRAQMQDRPRRQETQCAQPENGNGDLTHYFPV